MLIPVRHAAEESLYGKLIECGPLGLCACDAAKGKADKDEDAKDKTKSIKDKPDAATGKLCAQGEELTLGKWSAHPAGGCSSIREINSPYFLTFLLLGTWFLNFCECCLIARMCMHFHISGYIHDHTV